MFAVVTVATGIVVGYVALVPLAGVLQPLLFRTRALEPLAVAGVVMLGVLVAVIASIGPAKAVLRTDVMMVLREQ